MCFPKRKKNIVRTMEKHNICFPKRKKVKKHNFILGSIFFFVAIFFFGSFFLSIFNFCFPFSFFLISFFGDFFCQNLLTGDLNSKLSTQEIQQWKWFVIWAHGSRDIPFKKTNLQKWKNSHIATFDANALCHLSTLEKVEWPLQG